MNRVTVIGKNGFLARGLRNSYEAQHWRFLSHSDAMAETGWVNKTDILINCALHPDMKTGAYEPVKDIDYLLSAYIQNSDIHYIMLSSRAVYGAAPNSGILSENHPPAPDTPYAQNKFKTEQVLATMLPPERLTILRLGNIFGAEKGRKSFFGQMLEGLIESGVITLDIAPSSVRDFLPVSRWASTMETIAAAPQAGLYNLGSGFGITAEELTSWAIEAHGAGRCDYIDQSYKGQFILDITKLSKTYGLEIYTKADLKKCVTDIVKSYSP